MNRICCYITLFALVAAGLPLDICACGCDDRPAFTQSDEQRCAHCPGDAGPPVAPPEPIADFDELESCPCRGCPQHDQFTSQEHDDAIVTLRVDPGGDNAWGDFRWETAGSTAADRQPSSPARGPTRSLPILLGHLLL